MKRCCCARNGCRTLRNALWPVVQFYFSNAFQSSAGSVAIWIHSSASVPQVGFMSTTTLPIQEETCLFQSRLRSTEVPCSGVPQGSLAQF